MKGKVNQAYRFFFGVKLGTGAPATGLAASCTATVTAPDGATQTSPTVTEIGGGKYYFDIPASFTNTNGTGEYGVLVVVSSASVNDLASDVVEFHDNEVDDVATGIADIQSRLPAALVGGRMDSDVGNMQTDVLDANALAASAVAEIEAYLAGIHGAGLWDNIAEDWTTVEKNQIRFRLGVDGTQATPTSRAGTLVKCEKLLNNRQVLSNGDTGNLVTYDDDDATPIATSDSTDVNGDPVVLVPGMPASRSRGV